MSLSRREFLHFLAVAAAAGFPLASRRALAEADAGGLYELPPFGNLSLLHFTDCHAQLLPIYFREPSVNIGVGDTANHPPHLVGQAFLRQYGFKPGSAEAYAFTCLDFAQAAKTYGKVGGFAHLATLVKRLRASRPQSLLLDGGDTWQGSATALWTQGQDMIEAQLALGVDLMTAHWEFTYGADRVQQAVTGPLKDRIGFLAQNVRTADFGDPVFDAFTIRELGGVPVAVIGQAFPYTPIAHPRRFVEQWTLGSEEQRRKKNIDGARAKGAQLVVLLSHNGMDVDLKLASRVRGLDVIFGGHTHDGVPQPVVVKNGSGQTLVTNAGSNGKFLAVLDFEVKEGRVRDWRYRLLPIFANLLPADPDMEALIRKLRAPHEARLAETLATTESLLYRRGNFNGSFDQLILDAMMAVKNAEIAFSPGFRWGTTLLPGEAITYEHLLDQTAITYPQCTVNEFTGAQIKNILEDVCDNLFNPDPYMQQGGDMVRVGGLTYACAPNETMGKRISELRLHGKPLAADKKYKVAGWAPVAPGAQGEPIWEVVAAYLRDRKTVSVEQVNTPRLIGIDHNDGIIAS